MYDCLYDGTNVVNFDYFKIISQMSRKEINLPRKNSDLLGFEYEKTVDTRYASNKGKHCYSDRERVRIYYIKEKKEKQRLEQQTSSINSFVKRINKDTSSK